MSARNEQVDSDVDLFDDAEQADVSAVEDWESLPFAHIQKSDVVKMVKEDNPALSFMNSKRKDFQAICVMGETLHRTSFLKCIGCSEVLGCEGGQLSRHLKSGKHRGALGLPKLDECVSMDDGSNRKISEYLPHKMTATERDKIADAMGKLCLRSGRSFRFFGSEAFKQFVSDAMSVADAKYKQPCIKTQLPSREAVMRRAETLFTGILANTYEMVSQHIEDGLNIAVDFGKLKDDHLAIHLSFIALDKGKQKWKLQVLPIAFKYCFQPKTKDEVYRLVKEALKQFNFSDDDIRRCYLTADGAEYMKAAGNDISKFKGYVRCVSHSLHLIFERSMRPYQRTALTAEDEVQIAAANEAIESCRSLAYALRACKELKDVKLPNPGVQTRWLSYYRTVEETVAFLENDVYSLPLPGQILLMVKDVENILPKLKAIIYVFRLLPAEVDRFQAEVPLIQLVLPTLRVIRLDTFQSKNGNVPEDIQPGLDMDLVRSLGIAAHSATFIHYDQLCPVHFAAVMLDPLSKRMSKYSNDERKTARSFIEDCLAQISSQLPPKAPSSQAFTSTGVFADEPDVDIDVNAELIRYLAEDTPAMPNVEDYWPSRHHVYPRLYRIAKMIYSVIPSEATCERTFSRAAFIVDKSRYSMKAEKCDWVVTAASLLDASPDLLK